MFLLFYISIFISITEPVFAEEINLDNWFLPINRSNISDLHHHLNNHNIEVINNYDFTTVWSVKSLNHKIRGRNVVWLMTRSQRAGVGCCYTPAVGFVFEINQNGDEINLAEQLSCYPREDDIVLDWLTPEGYREMGKTYSAIICYEKQ